jgi:hypothetical protein
MNKIKTKFRIKLILLSLIISLGLSTFTIAPTALAEASECGTLSSCTIPADDICPTGYTSDPTLPTEDGTKACVRQDFSDQASESLLNTARGMLIVQDVLNAMIWPVLVMIGGLMDNSLLFGAGMQERLFSIWVPIRNLVNIFFVVILVGIALYNILGIGDENSNYSLKTILPQIIVGIILVNFSFTACKVVLDGVNALTTSVFLIPANVSEGLKEIVNDENDEHKGIIRNLCEHMTGFKASEVEGWGEEKIEQAQVERVQRQILSSFLTGKELGDFNISSASIEELKEQVSTLQGNATDEADKAKAGAVLKSAEDTKSICAGSTLSPTGKAFLLSWNQRNAAFGLALNMGKIVFYQDLHFSSLKSIDKTLVNSIMSMLLYLAYVGSFLALFVVLLARLIVLWLGIALSPILILIYGAPSLKEKLGSFGDVADQFMKNAIAPLIIAFALTVGWIMLHALQGLNGGAVDEAFPSASVGGIPVVGLSTIQDLITSIAVIGVVWVGVFSAAKGTIAESITDKIKSAGESAAKWAGSIPLKHINMVPVKLPGKDSENYTLSQIGQFATDKFNDTTKDRKLTRDFNEATGQKTNVTIDDATRGKVKPKDYDRLLKTLEPKLTRGDAATLKGLVDLKDKDPELYKKIYDKSKLFRDQNGDPKNIDNKLDDAGRIALGKELANLGRGAKELTIDDLEGAAPAADPSKPKKPAKKGKSSEIDETTKVGDKDIKTLAGAGDATALTRSYKGALTKIEAATEFNDSTKRTELETMLGSDDLRPGGNFTTPADVKKHIGPERYKNLTTIIGGGDPALGEPKLAELLKPTDPTAGGS